MNDYRAHHYDFGYFGPITWSSEFFSLRCRGEFILAAMIAPLFGALVRWGIGL